MEGEVKSIYNHLQSPDTISSTPGPSPAAISLHQSEHQSRQSERRRRTHHRCAAAVGPRESAQGTPDCSRQVKVGTRA